MKKSSTFRDFGSLVFSMLGYALILGGIGAIASDLFDWNLALSIGGSDIEIPADRYMGVFFMILGTLISALHHFWAPVEVFLKKHKLSLMVGAVVIVVGLFFGGKHLIMFMDGGPAITAAMNNDTETLTELFEKGEVKAEDHDQMVMWAAQKGHAETMKLLLEQGLSANATRDDGLSALKAACHWGGDEVVQLLKDAGAEGECDA